MFDAILVLTGTGSVVEAVVDREPVIIVSVDSDDVAPLSVVDELVPGLKMVIVVLEITMME